VRDKTLSYDELLVELR
jgi:progesterone-induced-blocking factor 1